MSMFNEPLLIKEADDGRISVENSHPEEMAKINELRAKRDSFYKEASKCQSEIDEIYNEIGDFKQFIGKVIVIDKGEDEDYSSLELMRIHDAERLYSGSRLIGSTIRVSTYENGECDVSYHKNDEMTVKYKSVNSVKVTKDEAFDELVNKAKDLMS